MGSKGEAAQKGLGHLPDVDPEVAHLVHPLDAVGHGVAVLVLIYRLADPEGQAAAVRRKAANQA